MNAIRSRSKRAVDASSHQIGQQYAPDAYHGGVHSTDTLAPDCRQPRGERSPYGSNQIHQA